ncbi:hypothetical protein [Actinacidiphila bryophytorum]|uniref:hypothetical protein n=1 Tax=Actinacidiphila bryophytorum TaxID=1436133 RepID=UPI002176CFCE|nr:hypothetical protein [Actinacidiphila bryophytorum]UWE13095.1 hypothetical protein NYE86_33400 [Actinacidiphila bryophytorum]
MSSSTSPSMNSCQPLQRPVAADTAAALHVDPQPVGEPQQADSSGDQRQLADVGEDLGEDLALGGQREGVGGDPLVGVQPLPQHRVGDVEAVEAHPLPVELLAQVDQHRLALPEPRHLEVDDGGAHRRLRHALHLGKQPGLADTAHADDVEYPRLADAAGQLGQEDGHRRLAVHEAAVPAPPPLLQHGPSPRAAPSPPRVPVNPNGPAAGGPSALTGHQLADNRPVGHTVISRRLPAASRSGPR